MKIPVAIAITSLFVGLSTTYAYAAETNTILNLIILDKDQPQIQVIPNILKTKIATPVQSNGMNIKKKQTNSLKGLTRQLTQLQQDKRLTNTQKRTLKHARRTFIKLLQKRYVTAKDFKEIEELKLKIKASGKQTDAEIKILMKTVEEAGNQLRVAYDFRASADLPQKTKDVDTVTTTLISFISTLLILVWHQKRHTAVLQ